MSKKFDEFWEEAQEDLRRLLGFQQLTDKEAEKAYQDAEPMPMSGELIDSITRFALSGGASPISSEPDLSWIDDIDFEKMTDDMELVLHRNRGPLDEETIRRLKELREKAFTDDGETMAEGTREEEQGEKGGPKGKPHS